MSGMDSDKLYRALRQAFAGPISTIAYSLHRQLRALCPDVHLLETSDSSFDFITYGEDGQAGVRLLDDGDAQWTTLWESDREVVEHSAENGVFEVDWKGHTLRAVVATWSEDGCEETHRFLLGEREAVQAFFKAVCVWNEETRGEVLVFESGRWEKSEELFEAIKSASLDDLIFRDGFREQLVGDIKRFLGSKAIYEKYGAPYKRGILLCGPPGNGKTHIIKGLIGELGLPCLYVKSLVARNATSHDSIRKIFSRARASAPCLLILEDLDALVTDDNRSLFLNELDGFANNAGVLTIATSNHPEKLDPAIVERPSRFDRRYVFELPAIAEREKYLRRWNRTLDPDAKLSDDELVATARRTEGFSYAFLKELALAALCAWVDDGGSPMDDVMVEQVDALASQIRGTNRRVGLARRIGER